MTIPWKSLPGRLASLRLTLVGMALLAAGAALSYDNPVGTPVWVLVVPLLLLSLNLLAAIVSNPRIHRRGGLLVFHLCLLGVVCLVAVGRLIHLDAHVELNDGAAFSADDLSDVRKGPWHRGRLDEVRFVQGPWTVDYAPGMVRGLTHSLVSLPDGQGGWRTVDIGDDRPLVVDGYRFYTSFNKGFSAVLTWMPRHGAPVTGVVNMPAYPLFDFRQTNRWQPPGSDTEIRFWLKLETGLTDATAWQLAPRRSQASLVVKTPGERVELAAGQTITLPGGVLRYDRLSSWMGYKIFYEPTIHWLFLVSVIGVIGLAVHFWQRFAVAGEVTASSTLPQGPGDGLRLGRQA